MLNETLLTQEPIFISFPLFPSIHPFFLFVCLFIFSLITEFVSSNSLYFIFFEILFRRINFLRYPDTHKFQGACFVEFEDTNGAKRALKMDGTEFLGVNIKVNKGGEKPKKTYSILFFLLFYSYSFLFCFFPLSLFVLFFLTNN